MKNPLKFIQMRSKYMPGFTDTLIGGAQLMGFVVPMIKAVSSGDKSLDLSKYTTSFSDPGTKQHADLMRQGRIMTDDQRLYTTGNVVYKPTNLTREQLYEGYLNMYKKVYSFKNILRRFPKANKSMYLIFNFIYRKYGRFTEKICRIIGYRNVGRIVEIASKLGNGFAKSGKQKMSFSQIAVSSKPL